MKATNSKQTRKAVRSGDWFGDVRALSPRLAWLANHNVKTHEFVSDPKDMRTFNHLGFGRWIAFVGRSVPPHEDSNRIWANGETEDEALVNLASGMGWRLWNEELAATRPLNAKSPNRELPGKTSV